MCCDDLFLYLESFFLLCFLYLLSCSKSRSPSVSFSSLFHPSSLPFLSSSPSTCSGYMLHRGRISFEGVGVRRAYPSLTVEIMLFPPRWNLYSAIEATASCKKREGTENKNLTCGISYWLLKLPRWCF